MATNPPSTVRVTVGQQRPTVTTVNYGTRTLKSASDLNISGAQDGRAIIYQANTNSFVIAPVTVDNISIDDGFF